MLRIIKWGLALAGATAAGLIVLAAVGFGSTASAQVAPGSDDQPGKRYNELLAQNLGISLEDLQTAETNARNQVIDEAVQAGKLTPEQGEKLKSLPLGAGLRFALNHDGHGKLARAVIHIFQQAAGIIGLPADQVRDQLQSGKSLAEIAQTQGIDEASLTSQLKDALTADINQALADGKIDQPTADRLLSNLDQVIDKAIHRTGGEGAGLRQHLAPRAASTPSGS